MDELDALWAFLVAAVVAFAVTPPVARLATRMGVVHQPRERDLHERPVPGSGRAGDPRRGPGGRALLHARGQGDARHRGRRDRDRAGRRDRRRASGRPSPGAEAHRSIRRRLHTRVLRGAGRERDAALHRPDPARRLELPAHPRRDRGGDERRELHGRRGRSRGGRLHDRRRHVRDHRAVARPDRRRHPRRAHRRSRDRLPLAQLPSGLDLHGRRRLEPARAAARVRGDPGRAEDGRGRRAVLPAC